jgi:hypothetical protein
MAGKKDKFLPKNYTDIEYIIFIHESECIFHKNNEDVVLKPSDAYIVPPKVKYQLKGITDFKGFHLITKEIKFDFFY